MTNTTLRAWVGGTHACTRAVPRSSSGVVVAPAMPQARSSPEGAGTDAAELRLLPSPQPPPSIMAPCSRRSADTTLRSQRSSATSTRASCTPPRRTAISRACSRASSPMRAGQMPDRPWCRRSEAPSPCRCSTEWASGGTRRRRIASKRFLRLPRGLDFFELDAGNYAHARHAARPQAHARCWVLVRRRA